MANPWAKGTCRKKTLNNVKSLEPNAKKYHAMSSLVKRRNDQVSSVYGIRIQYHQSCYYLGKISEDNIQTLYVDTTSC